MTPLFNNSQPILDNLSPTDPCFDSILLKFSNFFKICFQKCDESCILLGKFAKIFVLSTVWPPFYVLSE